MSEKNSTKRSILSSTLAVSILVVFIKFLGLIKQSVLAAYCGATEETDIFFIVSGVLVSLCSIVFSAISLSLLTIHTDKLIHESRESSNDLINKVLRCFLPISFLITLFFIIAAPLVARFLAPSYPPEKIAIMAKYIRMLSVVFVLWCYYLTVNVVLETDKRFLPGRCQGLFQNLFLIISAVFVYKSKGIDSLIQAFVFSGIAECIFVTWCSRKQFHLLFGRLSTSNESIKKLLKLSLPLIIGSAIYEINDIVDKQISSSLGAGSVSYLNYGSTINDLVTGVIVMAISIVLFANFSEWVSKGEIGKVENYLKNSLVYLTLLIFPLMALCFFAGEEIVSILYERGSFGQIDVQNTYWVAIGYAVGFIFSAARAIMVKVFYAFKDTRKPMINGLVSVSLNICLSILLSKSLGVWGISLATSLAMLVSISFMSIQLKQYLPVFNYKQVKPEIAKGFIAFVFTCFVLYASNRLFQINNIYLALTFKALISIIPYCLILMTLKSSVLSKLFTYLKIGF